MCCLQGVLGNEHHITNASELITFSNNVNRSTSYDGTTVLLDNNIDFTEDLSRQPEPIGKDKKELPRHIVSKEHLMGNLVMNSSLVQIGLFGYTDGATIRNVVLGYSCSILCSYISSSRAYVGGVVGRCGYCTIENVI